MQAAVSHVRGVPGTGSVVGAITRRRRVTPRTGDERTRRGRIAAAVLIGSGTLIGLVVLWHGAQPVGYAQGTVTGEVRRAVLSDPQLGVLREGELSADGSYRCAVPAAARTPVVILHGDGGSLVRSAAIRLREAQGELPVYELPPVALWQAAIRVREEDGILRFDWPPLPTGPGYPEPFRYSLLITYTLIGDSPGEASLLCRGPAMTIAHQELVELLKDHDTTKRELDLAIRAFNPGDLDGALWVGSSRKWTLRPPSK